VPAAICNIKMTSLTHRRTHNLLLISKLLNQRDHASPFTLVIDSLEQPAKPLLKEYLRRAKLGKSHSIFLAFETVARPEAAEAFITCWDKTPVQISQAVATALSAAASAGRRCLILVDSLWTLATLSQKPAADFNLTAFLSSLLQPPQSSGKTPIPVSLVAVYHSDVHLTHSIPYTPSPVELMAYLATTIIHIHSLSTLLAEKQARERSVAVSSFGLEESVEGVIIGLKPTSQHIKAEHHGTVLELEHRRKSGRGVHEWYFLPASPSKQATTTAQAFRDIAALLDDHPLFRRTKTEDTNDDQDLEGMTFSLGLTDRQRQDRDGVVLPYSDAQNSGLGPGSGGRILYDMGAEDDFDDEEDEI
jgi:elongator complex protein 5